MKSTLTIVKKSAENEFLSQKTLNETNYWAGATDKKTGEG